MLSQRLEHGTVMLDSGWVKSVGDRLQAAPFHRYENGILAKLFQPGVILRVKFPVVTGVSTWFKGLAHGFPQGPVVIVIAFYRVGGNSGSPPKPWWHGGSFRSLCRGRQRGCQHKTKK